MRAHTDRPVVIGGVDESCLAAELSRVRLIVVLGGRVNVPR